MDQITKRERELAEDDQCLPEFGPGPNYTTRQGHRREIKRYWNLFFRRLDQITKKKK